MIQHQSEGVITTALRVHLDAHRCLEVIPLRGPVEARAAGGSR
jgi:metal-responsive CopG/Arc/MetJ family transcriptional regulator